MSPQFPSAGRPTVPRMAPPKDAKNDERDEADDEDEGEEEPAVVRDPDE